MRVLTPIVLLALFVLSGTAAAQLTVESGVLRGRMTYLNESSGFCPAGTVCDGWKFLQSQTTDPDGDAVRWTKIVVADAFGNVIGQGSTDGDGNYEVAWNGLNFCVFGLCSLDAAMVRWFGEDVDGGFRLETSGGGLHVFSCTGIDLELDSTPADPQGTDCHWTARNENINAANNAADVFTAFLQSSILANDFHNLRIRTQSGECANGCARWNEAGKDGRVYLPEGGGFNRHARVGHEMGHIAEQNGSRDRHLSYESDSVHALENDFNGNGGWDNTSREYKGMATHEAIATFLGAHGNYFPDAFLPLQCNQAFGACTSLPETRLEDEPASCESDAFRRHHHVARWFWDLTDSRPDLCSEVVRDTTEISFSDFIDTLRAFPNGRDNHDKSEHVCCWTFIFDWYCDVCDSEDGRNTGDWQHHLGTMAQDQLRTCNCARH